MFFKLPNSGNSLKQIKRALTSVTASPFNGVYSVEDLEKRSLITTPKDAPLFNLLRNSAKPAKSRKFEWVESAVQTDLTLVKYNGYDPATDESGTAARGDNHLMAASTVPRVDAFSQSLESVDGNVMIIETAAKYLSLVRGIEWYLWNGDKSNNDETSGVKTLVTSAVDAAGAALPEALLQNAIIDVIQNGGTPTHIFATQQNAMTIANYASDRIRSMGGNVDNGIAESAFTYITPFGYNLQVIPVLPTFIGTGNVFILDMTKVKLRYSGRSVIKIDKLGETKHGEANIISSFFGLELKAANLHHKVITNVKNDIS